MSDALGTGAGTVLIGVFDRVRREANSDQGIASFKKTH